MHKAMEDVTAAAGESFFFDEKAGTFIVAGPQNRTHAFSPDGRHVTSFTLNPSSIEFRIRTRRWRHAEAAEVEELRRKTRECEPGQNSSGPPESS